MFIEIKKFVKNCFLVFERIFIISFKVNFLSIKTATLKETIYEKNTHGFKSCVLFCHYNKYGLILEQVREVCIFFQLLGIDVIFLTTKVSDESRNWLGKNVSVVITRKNLGRDFGAWKDGISFLQNRNLFANCSELYLINDSAIFIPNNLNNERFKNEFINDIDTDAIGLTESWQQAYHLQSYFLKFNKRLIHSKTFYDYWTNYPLINSRLFSIENGEIGISQTLLHNGYNLKALYSVSELLRKESINKFLSVFDALTVPNLDRIKDSVFNEFFAIDFTQMNPSHRLWALLLSNDCPVLKKDMVERNPENLVSIRYFMYLIESYIDDKQVKGVILDALCHIKLQYKFKGISINSKSLRILQPSDET